MGLRLFYFIVLGPAWDVAAGCCRGCGKASETPAPQPRVAQDVLQLWPVRGVLGQTPADQIFTRWGEKAESAGQWQKAPAQQPPEPVGPDPLCPGRAGERHGGTRPPPSATRAALSPAARPPAAAGPRGHTEVPPSSVRARPGCALPSPAKGCLLEAGYQPGETWCLKKSCPDTMSWSFLKGRLPQTMTYSSTPRDQMVAEWPW